MKIGVIGFGNLGRALTHGLVKSGGAGRGDILVCDKLPETLALAETEGFFASDDVNTVIKSSDAVFLTVKSYVFERLADIIDRDNLRGKTVVSFMAGVGFEKIFSLIGEVALVRAMPSLAVENCDGVIGYTSAPKDIAEIFRKLGYAFECVPEDIEKVMAFSSCGLGFAAYLIDALASAGEQMGFTPDTCASIAAQTFRNAVDRGGWKDTVKAVATPGGATEQGVLHMEAGGVYDIVAGAVKKAYGKMNTFS